MVSRITTGGVGPELDPVSSFGGIVDLGNVTRAVGVGRVVGVGHIDRRISRLEARIGYSKIGNLRMSLDLIAGGSLVSTKMTPISIAAATVA